MSTFLVCLRSRLVSEAVAKLISGEDGLEAVPVTPDRVVELVAGTDGVAGVLVDAHSSGMLARAGAVGCPVVVLGRREEDAAGLDGVAGGLPVDIGAAELVASLRDVVGGEVREVERSGRPVDRLRRASDRDDLLTPREREVLDLIAAAATPADIAATLDVSEHTVRTHVQNLLAKLGAGSKVDAVARARSLGLLDTGRSR